jgi:hypothetical protein
VNTTSPRAHRATTLRLSTLASLAAIALGAPTWARAQAPTQETALPETEVRAHYLGAPGEQLSASEGTVSGALLQRRPVLRPAEVLEFVPGVIVSQHSGDGKANQYYLRGFNLDHGTDFATWVDGMPVNMPTHAHGQGYTDLNFLIPELVQAIHYRKGTFAAEDGDFSSAGSARLQLKDTLPKGQASLTVGENRFVRTLLADSTELPAGPLLYAVEAAYHDGPWQNPQHHKRLNALLRHGVQDGATRHSLTAMVYSARWDSTDQVPQRAVASGEIGRFGAIDPSDGGHSQRSSLSWQATRVVNDGEWQAGLYAIHSRLSLFSNFSYFRYDEVNGDQFQQAEKRLVLGGQVQRSWTTPLAGLESRHSLGLQWRHDRLDPVGLYTAVGGERREVIQQSRVRQTSVGLHGQSETRWLPWLRSIAGLRIDRVSVDVDSSVADNSGQRSDVAPSPKLSLVFGPWANTEFFANTGWGFHSNDARGMTSRLTAKVNPDTGSRDAIGRADPLVRTRGQELGLRGEWLPGWQTSVALWRLQLDSELVFVGDAGETEASGASRRSGIELGQHWQPAPGWWVDLDLAWSKARFREDQGDAPNAGRRVPGAVQGVASFGVSFDNKGPWTAQFQLRHFGPRDLIEDGSARSKGTTLAYARLGRQLTPDTRVWVDVFNLFNRKVSDIDYFYESRLASEPSGQATADLHSHPAEPRTVRVSLAVAF